MHSNDANVREATVTFAERIGIISRMIFIGHISPHVFDPLLDVLAQVMNHVSEALGWPKMWHQWQLMHFGGGTPSIIILLVCVLTLLLILFDFLLQLLLLLFKLTLFLDQIVLYFLYILHHLSHISEVLLQFFLFHVKFVQFDMHFVKLSLHCTILCTQINQSE